MRDVSDYSYTSRIDNGVIKDVDATNVGEAQESKKTLQGQIYTEYIVFWASCHTAYCQRYRIRVP